jgi:hypothetical protein
MITAHSLFLSAAVREFDRIAIRLGGVAGTLAARPPYRGFLRTWKQRG